MQETRGPFGEEPRSPKLLLWFIILGIAVTTAYFTYDYYVNCADLGFLKGCIAIKKP